MWMVQPFQELFYELIGKLSPGHRRIVEALRRESAPRRPELARAVVSLHAPWWGFAAYGVMYAMTVMAIVAVVGAALIEVALKRVSAFRAYEGMDYFWVAAVLTAPLSSWPFRRWVRRRRQELLEVARRGEPVPGLITDATVVKVGGGFSLKGTAHSTHLKITCDGPAAGAFRGYVAKGPAWAAPGQPVELLALPGASHAILLSPDGGSRPLTRTEGPAGR